MKTKKHKSLCQHEHCEQGADKDRKSGLCEEHTQEWMRSPEWREAAADEDIRFWLHLRSKKSEQTANRLINKYKRRWLKRVTSEPEQEDAS